jgi:hypothetical protein
MNFLQRNRLTRLWLNRLALTAAIVACCGAVEAIELKAMFPAGARRGSKVQVELVGDFPEWPVTIECREAGLQWEVSAEEKGKVTVTLADDLVPGGYWVRVADAQGASRARRFWVSTVEEQMEPASAQEALQQPVVLHDPRIINGRLEKNNEVDSVAVNLTQGQELVAQVDAHRLLGSPMDCVLQLVDVASDVVLQQVDDTVGLDPQLRIVAPRTGQYLLRLFAFPETPNSRIGFAGSVDFVYRLNLSSTGILQAATPLSAGVSLAKEPLTPVWLGSPREQTVQQHTFFDGVDQRVRVFQLGTPGVAVVPLLPDADVYHLLDGPPTEPISVGPTLAVTGRVGRETGDSRVPMRAEPGSTLRIDVASRELNFPLDPVVTVLGDDNKQLAHVDDAGSSRDATLTVTVPPSGSLLLVIRDLHGRGGENFLYRATIEKVTPRWRVSVANEVFATPTDEPIQIAVTIERLDGYEGDLEIAATGLPEGVLATSATSRMKTDTEKQVTLTVQSAHAAHGPFRIIAVTPRGAEYRPATTSATVPGEQHQELYLVVKPK